jgi:hypothetical protein
MSKPKHLAQRLYVPVISLCLVLLLAHLLHSATFDPLVAAQNQRIRFQTGGESSTSSQGLAPGEVALAESVLDKQRTPDGNHTELLFIGNSQTIAIMDQTPGDMITPQWLQVLLARQNSAARKDSERAKPIEVNLGSLPNITAPELLIQLVAAGERSPRQADILIVSAVLEEFRGLGIRDEVVQLASEPEVLTRLSSLVEQGSDLSTVHTSLQPLLNSSVSSASTVATDSSHSSYAQRLERRLQRSSESVPLFADRDNLRGQVSLGYHEWRNQLLGITTSSVRPVPDSSYRATLEMIELALRYAQSAKIRVVLYLAPIRPIQPNPNLPSDVARFRRDVPALCRRYDAKCLDYVDLVPEELWTNYPDSAVGSKGERDFAHFTGSAHKLLAEKLMADLGSQLGFAEPEEKLSRR